MEPQKSNECIQEKNDVLVCQSIIPNGTFPDVTTLNITKIRLEQLDFHIFEEKFPSLVKLSIIGTNTTQLQVMEMPSIPLVNIKVSWQCQ